MGNNTFYVTYYFWKDSQKIRRFVFITTIWLLLWCFCLKKKTICCDDAFVLKKNNSADIGIQFLVQSIDYFFQKTIWLLTLYLVHRCWNSEKQPVMHSLSHRLFLQNSQDFEVNISISFSFIFFKECRTLLKMQCNFSISSKWNNQFSSLVTDKSFNILLFSVGFFQNQFDFKSNDLREIIIIDARLLFLMWNCNLSNIF